MTFRKVALNTAVVLATLLGALLLWEFRQAVIIFLFSLSLAAAIRPFVDRSAERGLPRVLALALVYLLLTGIFAVILFLVGSSLVNELQVAGDSLARFYDQIWREWPKGTEVQQMIIQQLPAPADLYNSFSIERQNSATQALLGFTLNTFGIFSNLFAVLFLSFYWSLDQVHFERLWLSLFPVESRARYRDIWRAIERDFGQYIRSELLQSLLAGLLLGLGFWLMGLPFATLLAVLGAVMWLIPWLGGVLILFPVALSGLAVNLWMGIGVSAYTIAVLFFLELVVEPRFIRQRQYSSLLNILMILALSEPFGLFGFIVAPPLAAAIELIFRYSLQNRIIPFPVESLQRMTDLRARIESVRVMLNNSANEPERQTVSMLDRMETLIEKANHVLEEENAKSQIRSSTRR